MVKPQPFTFLIPQVRKVLNRHVGKGLGWVDPTAGWNSPAEFTNDLNLQAPTKSHTDALSFLAALPTRQFHGVILDPPYSPRQMKDCYESVGRTMLKEDGMSSFWAQLKDEAARLIAPGGKCLTFGWNSVGLGRSRGFLMQEVHLFPSGGMHNDTILTVERRANQVLPPAQTGS